jgi:hypothetical protein
MSTPEARRALAAAAAEKRAQAKAPPPGLLAQVMLPPPLPAPLPLAGMSVPAPPPPLPPAQRLLTAATPEPAAGVPPPPPLPPAVPVKAKPASKPHQYTEEQFQAWQKTFEKPGMKITVDRPSYLSADNLAQMEIESVTSSTRVPTTLPGDKKDLDDDQLSESSLKGLSKVETHITRESSQKSNSNRGPREEPFDGNTTPF